MHFICWRDDSDSNMDCMKNVINLLDTLLLLDNVHMEHTLIFHNKSWQWQVIIHYVYDKEKKKAEKVEQICSLHTNKVKQTVSSTTAHLVWIGLCN